MIQEVMGGGNSGFHQSTDGTSHLKLKSYVPGRRQETCPSHIAEEYLNLYREWLPATINAINGQLLTQSGQSDILIIRFMKKTSITVTEASRNFADCINRAHYQNVTFVLLKNGEPVARLIPDNEKVCVGRDLAEALAKNDLPENEARAWHRDLEAARKSVKAPADKWR